MLIYFYIFKPLRTKKCVFICYQNIGNKTKWNIDLKLSNLNVLKTKFHQIIFLNLFATWKPNFNVPYVCFSMFSYPKLFPKLFSFKIKPLPVFAAAENHRRREREVKFWANNHVRHVNSTMFSFSQILKMKFLQFYILRNVKVYDPAKIKWQKNWFRVFLDHY